MVIFPGKKKKKYLPVHSSHANSKATQCPVRVSFGSVAALLLIMRGVCRWKLSGSLEIMNLSSFFDLHCIAAHLQLSQMQTIRSHFQRNLPAIFFTIFIFQFSVSSSPFAHLFAGIWLGLFCSLPTKLLKR